MRTKLTKRLVDALRPTDKPVETRDTEVRGLLVRVEPSGLKGLWYVYRHGGVKNRHRLGTYPALSVDGGRVLAQAVAGDVARGIDPSARRKAERLQVDRDRLATLGRFLNERYEPWALANLKSGKTQIERVRSDFAAQLQQPMHTFSPFMMMGLRQKWKKEGLTSRTIDRDEQRLQSVLARAVEWGILERHPLVGLKPLRYDDSGRVRYLSTDEEAALRSAIAKREDTRRAKRLRLNTWRIARHLNPFPESDGEDRLSPLILLALNTGLRRGELFSLRWADVNLTAKMLTVVAASAKSGKRREVPLNVEALAVLNEWREKSHETVFVFPGKEGARLTNVNKSWRGVVKLAGLTNFHFHDLRHTFASRLVQAGIDLNTVRELLGHAEIATTLVYSHLAPANLRAAVERVAG
jgi:integrase